MSTEEVRSVQNTEAAETEAVSEAQLSEQRQIRREKLKNRQESFLD